MKKLSRVQPEPIVLNGDSYSNVSLDHNLRNIMSALNRTIDAVNELQERVEQNSRNIAGHEQAIGNMGGFEPAKKEDKSLTSTNEFTESLESLAGLRPKKEDKSSFREAVKSVLNNRFNGTEGYWGDYDLELIETIVLIAEEHFGKEKK